MCCFFVAFSIFWLWVGSRDAVDSHRMDVREDKFPKPNDMSVGFSGGSAYILLVMGCLFPLAYLLRSNGILTQEASDALVEAHGSWVFAGILLVLLVFLAIFTMACEWLLRKMARFSEPGVRFERLLFLN